jgi:GNAT superfamily N-acetyltransferase
MVEELRAPVSDDDWAAYHDIRRHVLFELRGHGASYDTNHPDEHQPGHHPLILWVREVPVGVVRVDVRGGVATLRRVAIRADLQRRGYGRRLLELAEGFARANGCARAESHVDPGAIGFYARSGYALVDAKDTSGSPLMAKELD